MAKGIHKLNAGHLRQTTGPKKLGDGGGLWLFISKSGTKSWVFRYNLFGNSYEMGLGSINDISLSEARNIAQQYRKLKNQGIDPITHRDKEKEALRLQQAKSITFAQCATSYIENKQVEWANKKHAQQWKNTLVTYVYPVFRNLSIADIDTSLVLKALEPIWETKTETATRIRQRIEAIIDWATVRQFRQGENPARWKGHLDKILPQPSKLKKVEHFAALHYNDVPSFMKLLRKREAISARALEFLILNGTRTSETRQAIWEEIDFDSMIWTIPAEKTKSDREHRVPLSKQSIRLLQQIPQSGNFIFWGQKLSKPISDGAMRQILVRMKNENITVHGFRSSFRDWVAEKTDFRSDIAEAALEHAKKDKVEAAYQRGDLLEKRRVMMQAWADYLDNLTKSKT